MENHKQAFPGIAEVWNCKHAFQQPCPMFWEDLSRTDRKRVRHCEVCKQDVTYCTTPEEFVQLGNAGKCVAIPDGHSPLTPQTVVMGLPSPEYLQKLKAREQRIKQWWRAVLECGPTFSPEGFSVIAEVLEDRNQPLSNLSPEDHKYFSKLYDASLIGPEAVYLHLRTRPSGKRENEQNIFKYMQTLFPMRYEEFKALADRLEKEHPGKP